MIARARRYRQHLWGEPAAGPVEVVRWFGAMQAQEYLPARWSVGQRCRATLADVDAALAAGRLLRTHLLRPTWHFVAAEDIRWLLAATAPRVHRLNAHYYRKTGIDDGTAARCRAVFERVLGDGQHLTRRELAAALAAAGLPDRELSLGYAVIHAELEGVLASGAMRGKQQTYALLDARLDGVAPHVPDDPLVELVRVYLRAHGPATVKDLVWWASLRVADVRRGLDALGAEVVSYAVDGRTYWDVAGAPPLPEAAEEPRIDLIQVYDEYSMAYTESRDVLARPDALPADMGSRLHPLLLDGGYFGRWGLTLDPKRATLDAQLPRALSAAEAASLDARVARLADFLGVPVQGSNR